MDGLQNLATNAVRVRATAAPACKPAPLYARLKSGLQTLALAPLWRNHAVQRDKKRCAGALRRSGRHEELRAQLQSAQVCGGLAGGNAEGPGDAKWRIRLKASCATVMEGRNPRVIENSEGARTTPR
eukprot:scaffold28_cov312-Pinguiococcus_pyrenoidosus.AAC.11